MRAVCGRSAPAPNSARCYVPGMPGDATNGRLEANGLELAYREVGSGSETVVFSHSFLVDSRQFDAQIEALSGSYRVISFDHRDHGESGRADRPYEMADLVADGARVVEGLDATPCHWVGLSTGGFVGMRLALEHPEWFRTLTLMDTSATAEDVASKIRNKLMLTVLRVAGVKPLVGRVMKLMFADPFLDGDDFAETRALWHDRIAAGDRAAIRRFADAIGGRDDVLDRLRSLDLPVHAISGADDRALAASHAKAIAEAVPGSTLSLIPGAGHLCTIETPAAVNDVLVPFIESHRST